MCIGSSATPPPFATINDLGRWGKNHDFRLHIHTVGHCLERCKVSQTVLEEPGQTFFEVAFNMIHFCKIFMQTFYWLVKSCNIRYSHLFNKRGGWNKRGGGAKVAKSLNVEL